MSIRYSVKNKMLPTVNPSAKQNALQRDLCLGPSSEIPFNPNLHPFIWRIWWDYGTGALIDVGYHFVDIPFRTLWLHYPTDAECSVGSVFSKLWTLGYNPEGCSASFFITFQFAATKKSKSPIEITWSDGGICPSHPDIIPVDHDIGGFDSANDVMIVG